VCVCGLVGARFQEESPKRVDMQGTLVECSTNKSTNRQRTIPAELKPHPDTNPAGSHRR
jgi:hypothetical protein